MNFNDILMISRLEAKEAEISFSPVRVAVLVEDIRRKEAATA